MGKGDTMPAADFAIIGGTGVYEPDRLEEAVEYVLSTPYGETACAIGEHEGKRVAFMRRHGKGHSVPPHQVNYRANIWALRDLGVTRILATAAVGSLRLSLPPGTLVAVDQFIDFTKSRPLTFFEGEAPVTHTDMTDPYCREVRAHLTAVASGQDVALVQGGTYVCTEGPRFETPAEIRMFAQLGGDVVGMTSVPEAPLAKELGMCYATVAMVTNFCAGISGQPLTHREVLDEMAKSGHLLRQVLFAAIAAIAGERSCGCANAAGSM